jgi:hypothetical protein
MIQRLKERALGTRLGDQESWDAFELIVAACSSCCTNRTGGNETCPPKQIVVEE